MISGMLSLTVEGETTPTSIEDKVVRQDSCVVLEVKYTHMANTGRF
ncbi:hypothetical protein ES702_03072 [subsurface metagenome]